MANPTTAPFVLNPNIQYPYKAMDGQTFFGGTSMHRAIVGDPQADGGPNPELVETYGPIRVTPLRNLPQRQAHASWARLPHFNTGGTDDDTSSYVADDFAGDGDNDGPATGSTPPPAPPVFNNQPAPAADQAAPNCQPWDSPPGNDHDSSVAPDDENPQDTSMDDDPESSTESTSGQAQSPPQKPLRPLVQSTWEVSKPNVPTIALYNGAAHGGEHFREAADYYAGAKGSAKIDVGPMADGKGNPYLNSHHQPQYSYSPEKLRDTIQKTGASRIMLIEHSQWYIPKGTREQSIGQAFNGKILTPESEEWKSMVQAMPPNKPMTVVFCGCGSGNGSGGPPSRDYLNGFVDVARKYGRSVEIVAYGQSMISGPHGTSSCPQEVGHAPSQAMRELGSEFRAPRDTTDP